MPEEVTTEEIGAPPAEEAESEEEISRMEALREGIFFSPVGFIMMSFAALVDVSEFFAELIPGAGTILSIIIDIAALLFIGGWMYWRSGTIRAPKKTAARIAKVAKWAKRLKWLRPLLIVIEMIPIIGSAPCWILAVYFELKYGEG